MLGSTASPNAAGQSWRAGAAGRDRSRLRATADDDLLEIVPLIAEDDEIVADRFVHRIRTSVRRLAHYPLSAPARPELGSDIRSLVVGHYVVLHRVTSDQVRILRILHGSRDLATALIGED